MINVDKDIRHKTGIRGGRGYFARHARAVQSAIDDGNADLAAKIATSLAHEGRLEISYRKRVATRRSNVHTAVLRHVQNGIYQFYAMMQAAERSGDAEEYVYVAECYEHEVNRLFNFV